MKIVKKNRSGDGNDSFYSRQSTKLEKHRAPLNKYRANLACWSSVLCLVCMVGRWACSLSVLRLVWLVCVPWAQTPPPRTPQSVHVLCVCFSDWQLASQRRGHVLGGFLSAKPPKPFSRVELPNNHTSLYSSVAERQSCKLKVLGSIPSGGCFSFR